MSDSDVQLSFVEHLSELRRRLISVFVVLIAGSAACYFFIDHIVDRLLAPASGAEFIYLAPPELFLAYVRLSITFGVVITLPFTLLQIWLFVRPALSRAEKTATGFVLIAGTAFFAVGAYFAYAVILPITLRFFVGYATRTIEPLFSFGSYVGFVNSILLAFGIAFELPVVIVMLARIGLVSPPALRRARAYVFLALAVTSALLTPPDVVSQLLLIGPMMALYELSIVLARVFAARRQRELERTLEV